VSLVAIGSVRSSPGATTTAVALAAVWARRPRAALLVEADPDGGVLAARLGGGHHPSFTDLAALARAGLEPEDLWQCAQVLPGGVPAVLAHPAMDQCQAALRVAGARVADCLVALADHDAVVDVGRLRPGSAAAAFVERADVLLVVLRPRLEDIDAAAHRLSALDKHGNVGLVVVGDRPYPTSEVQRALARPVLGTVAFDPRSAAALTGGPPTRALGRLPLLRSAAALAEELAAVLDAADAAARPQAEPVR
jgi:MinD-like ATPase involved in chromosome partitioning or flagellar assembly